MTCQYLMPMCTRTKQLCPYAQVNGECKEMECENASIPTWQDLIDVYVVAKNPTHRHLSNIKTCVKLVVDMLGVAMDSKVAVTAEQFDVAYDRMRKTLKPNTIATSFATLKACTNRNNRDIKLGFNRIGKVIPDIDTPRVQIKIMPIYELTDEQRLKLEDIMTKNRLSGTRVGIQRFKWLWLRWRRGVRQPDICTMTWGNIKRHPSGKWWLDYVPSKTSKKCMNRHAGGEIPSEEYAEIAPFRGDDNDYIIDRYSNYAPNHVHKHGEYVGKHATLERYCTNTMHEIGVPMEIINSGNLLRKDCAARLMREKGIAYECQALGHTPPVALSHYVNQNNIEFK